MNKDEASDLALEALEESVDLVREDYENAKKLYGNYPSRQARLLGMEDGLLKHEAAITALKQARSAPVQDVSLINEGKTAAQRQWVGLTQEEFRDFATTFEYGTGGLIRAIEAKLKEKNT
jgi:hypothetical protein